MTDGQPPSGWFPDPLGRYDHRWFNGRAWTADVAVDGQRFVDPQGAVPSASTGGTHDAATGRNATVAVVCGLVGLSIAWIPLLVLPGTILGVVAAVSGWRSARSARSTGRPRGRPTAGLALGVAALAASVVGWTLTVSLFREVIAFVEPGPRLVEDVSCTMDGGAADVRGTLTNLDDRERGYTVFATVGGRNGASRYVAVPAIAPGDRAAWEIRVDGVTLPDGPCDAEVVVNGPFPWGIETDPYVE